MNPPSQACRLKPSNKSRLQAVIEALQHYGPLPSLLASRSGDLAGAEDALAEAFESALRVWPEKGAPS